MKRVITVQDVPASGELRVPVGTIVTPSASEVAASRGVRIIELPEEQLSALAPATETIAIKVFRVAFENNKTSDSTALAYILLFTVIVLTNLYLYFASQRAKEA